MRPFRGQADRGAALTLKSLPVFRVRPPCVRFLTDTSRRLTEDSCPSRTTGDPKMPHEVDSAVDRRQHAERRGHWRGGRRGNDFTIAMRELGARVIGEFAEQPGL